MQVKRERKCYQGKSIRQGSKSHTRDTRRVLILKIQSASSVQSTREWQATVRRCTGEFRVSPCQTQFMDKQFGLPEFSLQGLNGSGAHALSCFTLSISKSACREERKGRGREGPSQRTCEQQLHTQLYQLSSLSGELPPSLHISWPLGKFYNSSSEAAINDNKQDGAVKCT